MPAESFGRGRKHARFPIERQRRHRIWFLAGALEWICARLPGYTDLPLSFGIERLQILIGDWPIFQRAAFGSAIHRTHSEIALHIAPRHGAVAEGSASDAGSNVVVRSFARQYLLEAAVRHLRQPDIVLVLDRKSTRLNSS